jgi:hypothetical protein
MDWWPLVMQDKGVILLFFIENSNGNLKDTR